MKSVNYNGIKVFYEDHLDGGGRAFGQDYIQAVRDKFGKVECIYEFCAGPGFIGFSLLAHDLCDRLVLSDINPEAVKACKKTIRYNKLQDKVSVYLSDGLDKIPRSEKFDLVVGNPPHFKGTNQNHDKNIIFYDRDWNLHYNFYENVVKYLRKGGSTFLQENEQGSTDLLFVAIAGNVTKKLEHIDTYKPKNLYLKPSIIRNALKTPASFLEKLRYPYYFVQFMRV